MARSENGKQKLIRLIDILVRNTDEDHGLTIAEIIDKLSEYGIAAEYKGPLKMYLNRNGLSTIYLGQWSPNTG